MVLDFQLYSILDAAGIIQGCVFGLILFGLNKWRENYSYYLGFFLILFSLQRIPYFLEEQNIFGSSPEYLLLPTFSLWILSPIFFLYTQKVSVFSDQKFNYWILLPGLIHYVIQIYIFFLPDATKLVINDQSWLDMLKILGLVFSSFIVIRNIQFINKHKIEVYNQYALTRHKELSWAKSFLIFYLAGTILYGFQLYAVPVNLFSKIFFLSFDLLLIYWLSFQGVLQLNVHSILTNHEKMQAMLHPKTAAKSQSKKALETSNLERLFQKISDYIITSEVYANPDLTIATIAHKMEVHPRRVSNAINTVSGKNFNNFVNELRVKKAIELLKNQELKQFSIEGIGYKVGFRSKSVFYAAFKKITGTTPVKFKKAY